MEPYLSVVVATRNDDHGGDPLKRLQAFVNCFDAQCRRTGLDAELIVVEWNPPTDRPKLDTLLRLPAPSACVYRFVEVPPEIHQTLRHADVLPLFQMIAKNVGIRRAKGRFVLATNIDIIFSNELIEFIAAKQLEPGRLYRVDRHDIESDFPVDAPLAAQMEYCRSHQLREHTRWGSYPVDPAGRVVSQKEDVVDGRTVRLGGGWHVREGGGGSGTRCYRWASDEVELIVDAGADGMAAPAVLDVEIESSPYHRDSWVEVVATEEERTLARTRVAGQAHLLLPLGTMGAAAGRTIHLRVTDSHAESRRHLPAFERRSALCYRVMSARLRPLAPADREWFEYPAARWTNANDDSPVRLIATPEGLRASTSARAWSNCVQYGPVRSVRAGLYRFNVTCSVVTGEVTFGVLSGDRTVWLPATVNRRRDAAEPSRFEIAVELPEGAECWLVAFNAHPDGDGVSTFVIHRLEGSEDPARAIVGRGLALRRSPFGQRWRLWAGACADLLAKTIGRLLGHRLRYRVARATPEFQAVDAARRESDRQLRELAPLGYLGGVDRFLREQRPANLHQNGCGDFQLTAREHWFELRGYPEFEMFSMNIDGLFNSMAQGGRLQEQRLEVPLCIYHLEHEKGSGWTPEGEALLRRRIAESGITWLENETVHILGTYMEWFRRPMLLNGADWGFAGVALPEIAHAPVLGKADA